MPGRYKPRGKLQCLARVPVPRSPRHHTTQCKFKAADGGPYCPKHRLMALEHNKLLHVPGTCPGCQGQAHAGLCGEDY